MSTTSAAGTDYVSINPVAIAALLLGVASVLALVSDSLLIVPLAGVICSIMAIVQIRRSSGTQTGRGFAILGMVLAVGISAGRVAIAGRDYFQARSDSQQLAPVIVRLSKTLHAARYDEAYDDLFSSAFRIRVDRKTFTSTFEQYSALPNFGPVRSVVWPGQTVEFTDVGTSGVRMGYMLVDFNFEHAASPMRPMVTFSTRDGAWRIDNIALLFPDKTKKQATLE
jgi:hypothetical protein